MMDAPGVCRLPRFTLVVLLAVVAVPACASLPENASPLPSESTDQVRVGYGIQDRGTLTGAVSSVSQDDIEAHNITRLEDLINGRFAGVTAERRGNGQISIRIRGSSTLMGSDEPLFVIDGMPMTAGASAFSALNPYDISRIDIMKDAGATAIYGSRGANGVVMVTTKRAH
jgi:TonB-dependent SusC/RagA subfamily outer membrane receptor